jgi:hypothetical protein
MGSITGLGALIDPEGVAINDAEPPFIGLLEFRQRRQAAAILFHCHHPCSCVEQCPGQPAGPGPTS